MAKRRSRKPKQAPEKEPEFQRTEAEQALVHLFDERRGIPGVEPDGDKAIKPKIDDYDLWAAQIADLTKIYEPLAMEEVLNPLCRVSYKTASDKAMNSGLGLLKEIAPRDGIEGLLATQMIVSHRVGMEMARRAMIEGQTFEGCEAAVKRSAQMMRLFTKQVEALNAHRGKTSQQKVTVEHVHVHEGGQAIVGNVAQGGGGQQQEGQAPHAKEVTHAPEPALRSQDEAADVVPISGHGKR